MLALMSVQNFVMGAALIGAGIAAPWREVLDMLRRLSEQQPHLRTLPRPYFI
jgi:hypothetical protein